MGSSVFDFPDTDLEVYFSSCDTLVPFKNPSDAAIARLSAQKGFTLAAVQAVLDLIVFNPSFNSREVTFASAGSVDEVVAEYREMQFLQLVSVEDEEMGSRNGATSPLAISLVVSQIEHDMLPFSQAKRLAWWCLDFELLINMSLVHRSWTMAAQELLSRRVRSDLAAVRSLLQHPFCSRIRELEVGEVCMSDDDLDRFALLLRRLPSLRRLSLHVLDVDGFALAHRDDICDKIYSEIASCLPNLVELWIQHSEISLLEDCVKCIVQSGSGIAPFILKEISISDNYDGSFWSEILLCPAQLHPIVHHETPRYPSTYSNPQAPNSKDMSKCSITVKSWDNRQMAYLFGTGGVFRNILPVISHFTLYYGDFHSPTDVTEYDSFLASFLGECYSLAHMNVFLPCSSRQEMTHIPFSSISESLQMLSIYYDLPVDTNTQKRASGLERVVRTIRDREAGSSFERIEVTFCRGLGMVDRQALQQESVETVPPEYLDPVRRMCHELDIDFVCKILE